MTDVQSYLARVGYKGSTSPTLETLRAIHYAHLLNVPFENLDIALGRRLRSMKTPLSGKSQSDGEVDSATS